MAGVTCAVLIATAGAATAHHSSAIYDNSWLSLEGTVVEYRYANPHATILLKAHGPGSQATIWSLEGPAPASLAREGWSRATLRPGDALKMSIMPLRSGANGGFWHPRWIHDRNGKPFSRARAPSRPIPARRARLGRMPRHGRK